MGTTAIKMSQPDASSSMTNKFSWNKKFAARGDMSIYKTEDTIYLNPEDEPSTEDVLKYFLRVHINWTPHGPLEFSYASIRKFILDSPMKADLTELRSPVNSGGE